jgi:hypothetical protein
VAAAPDAKPAEGRLSPAETVLTIAALIEEYAVRTGLCTRAFPAKLDGLTEPFTERVRLLNSLGTRGTAPAADEIWDGPAAPK